MDEQFDLGAATESAVSALVDSGRYSSREDLLREGVRLVQEREKRLSELDAAIEASIAEADSGQTIDAETLFDELLSTYSASSRAAE